MIRVLPFAGVDVRPAGPFGTEESD